MVRELLILTVVASLVWCPIRCLAASVPSATATTEKPAPRKCACCRHHAVDTDTSSPKSPAPVEQSGDCDCPDCLCKGAVTASQVPVDAALALTSVNIVATVAFDVGNASYVDAERLDVPIRSALGGSEIVVLYGNLRR